MGLLNKYGKFIGCIVLIMIILMILAIAVIISSIMFTDDSWKGKAVGIFIIIVSIGSIFYLIRDYITSNEWNQ
jgi:carbon starvation protein CstA